MANWSDLSQDVLVSIASLMGFLEDFLAFGQVCTSWRFAATKENFTGSLSQQVPLLLLSPRKITKTAAKTVGEFYNMRTGETRKLSPALLANIKNVHSSSLGWVFTVSEDLRVTLLHPFNHNHHMVELPNSMDGKCFRGNWNMFALSSSPSTTSDYLVMAVYDWKRLAFCRPGDDGLTIVDEEHHRDSHDITYYKGQYYIVDSAGQIWVCDIEDPKQARRRKLNDHPIPVQHGDSEESRFYYLVESEGVLLAVQCTMKSYNIRYFRVFEVPFDNGEWSDREVTTLGNRTLFLCPASSFSVETSSTYSSCMTNCIYFNQHIYGRRNFGVFKMEDRKIDSSVAEHSDSLIPLFWIQPSL